MRRRGVKVYLALDIAATSCHCLAMQQKELLTALDQAINNLRGACSDEDVPNRDLAEWQKAAWLLSVLAQSLQTFNGTCCHVADLTAALCWLARNCETLADILVATSSSSLLLDATGRRIGGGAAPTAGQENLAEELRSKARIWRAAVNVGRLYSFDCGEDEIAQRFHSEGAAVVALFSHTTAKLLQMLTQARSQTEAGAAMFLVSTFAADTAYLAAEVAK